MSKPNAREAILDTAERLFAEQGMESVSLRMINTEAGYSVAALHYHFGTRDKLIDELLVQRQGLILDRRQQLLDELSRKKRPDVRGISEALVLPFAELLFANPESGLRTIKFFFRSYVEQRKHKRVRKITEQSYRIFDKLLAQALPKLSPDVLERRWAFATELTFQGLANADTILASRNTKPSLNKKPLIADYQHYTALLLDFIVGGLAAKSK